MNLNRPLNIILIGFMGTGKSLIGSRLAKLLQYRFRDIDREIESANKMTITEIFQLKGENYFRDLESDRLKLILQSDRQVIATGGGIVLRQENMDLMQSHGFIISLTATPDIIYSRIAKCAHRPLLGDKPTLDNIQQLMKSRELYYQKADFVIDTSDLSSPEVIQIILEKLKINYSIGNN